MEDKNLQNQEEEEKFETKILRNDEANPNDSAVIIEEEDRTVLLTENETIVIDKQETYSIAPKNRPRKPYAGMWGIPEMVTVALATLTLLTLFLIYLFLVLPSQRELNQNRAKQDAVEKELISAKKKFGSIENTETQVAKLVTSVADFESRFLKDEAIGKTAIYQRLNGLINRYGLTNTTGPDYAPLEISDQERQQGGDSEAQRGRSKFQSLFPGVYVTTTVEGSYLSLRGFLREVEASDEFLVISAIELEPAEENDSKEQGEDSVKVTQTSGKTRGTVVSLRLEMAAYFQRPADQRLNTALPERDKPLEDVVEN